MTQRVLVPMDTSGPATAALEYALTQFPDADIVVLYACGIDETDERLQQRVLQEECNEERARQERIAEGIFRAAVAAAERASTSVSTVFEYGLPVRTIIAYAEEHDIDQIVIGTHNRTGLSRLLLGSVAETIVRQSSIPVTVSPDPNSDRRSVET